VYDGYIQDPQIVREIANRFEILANEVDVAVKVSFDPSPAVQSLRKQADFLESLNVPLLDYMEEVEWRVRRPQDDTSGEGLVGGG
jgi:hypothetical protein